MCRPQSYALLPTPPRLARWERLGGAHGNDVERRVPPRGLFRPHPIALELPDWDTPLPSSAPGPLLSLKFWLSRWQGMGSPR